MNTSNPFDSSLGLRADDDDAQPNLRRFKHRLIADGIESVCLRCCQLVNQRKTSGCSCRLSKCTCAFNVPHCKQSSSSANTGIFPGRPFGASPTSPYVARVAQASARFLWSPLRP
jgi:hypothetical protein